MKSCIKLNSIFLDERLSFLQCIQERRQKRKALYLHAAIKIQATARGLMLRSVLESTILDAKKRKRARSELQSSLACLTEWALMRRHLNQYRVSVRSRSAKAIQDAHRRQMRGQQMHRKRRDEAATSIQRRSRQGISYEYRARANVETIIAAELIQTLYRRHRTVARAVWRSRRLQAVAALVIQAAMQHYRLRACGRS